jgi:hypothetical protein
MSWVSIYFTPKCQYLNLMLTVADSVIASLICNELSWTNYLVADFFLFLDCYQVPIFLMFLFFLNVEKMIRGLTQVPWERVDVSFETSKQRYVAHSTIQVRLCILTLDYKVRVISFWCGLLKCFLYVLYVTDENGWY